MKSLIIFSVMLLSLLILLCSFSLWKLLSCGVSFKKSLLVLIKLPKYIDINVKLFIKYKKSDFKKAMRILMAPIKYVSYLENIASTIIRAEKILKNRNRIYPTLSIEERAKLDAWISSQGITVHNI